MRTITRLYDRYGTAQQVVRDLESAGIPQADISIIANDLNQASHPVGGTYPGTTGTGITETGATSAGPGATQPADTSAATGAGTGAGTGAVAGTLIGGGLGLLAGIGSLAIPGIGPVVAAGWLVATLTGAGIGATAGGLVGALSAAGISREEADVYAEEIRRGASVVSVRAPDNRESEVEAIMNRHDPVDWQARRGTYSADWGGFNPGDPGVAGPPPESVVTDAAVPAADRTLTNRPADELNADRPENVGKPARRRVMETASRANSSLDERIDAAEERLRERRPSGPEATPE